MMGSLDTLGLRVETVSPSTFSNNIDINSEIKITFNSELNSDLIVSGIALLEDKDKKYIRNNMIKDLDDYDVVPVSITYKDKTIFMRPTMPLKEDCRYIIFADKRMLQDILGNMMLTDYITYFDTSSDSYNVCSILIPENNSIIPVLDKINITETDCDRYCLQISKQPGFETVVYDEIVDGTNVEKIYPLEDGLYYIRAKEENAPEYGIANIFSIKSFKSTTVSDQDLDEDYIFEPLTEEELKVIESYPANDVGLVNVKSNSVYMKLNKLIDIDNIDFYESSFEGELVDDNDKYMEENLNSNQMSHQDVDGHYVFVQDEEKEETYIFFVPDTL